MYGLNNKKMDNMTNLFHKRNRSYVDGQNLLRVIK